MTSSLHSHRSAPDLRRSRLRLREPERGTSRPAARPARLGSSEGNCIDAALGAAASRDVSRSGSVLKMRQPDAPALKEFLICNFRP